GDMGQFLMIGSHGGKSWKISDKLLVAAPAIDAHVKDRRYQDDPVGLHPLLLEDMRETGRPKGAVRLAHQKFRRIPSLVDIDISPKGLREGVDICIDCPEVIGLCFSERPREPGTDRIQENQIRLVQNARVARQDSIRRWRQTLVTRSVDSDGTEATHEQPHARGSW